MASKQKQDRPSTLYLIDGSGYIFRAYYGIRPLSTSTGTPTNAVLGFGRMLHKLLREEQPDLLGIAFDHRDKTFRHEVFPEYKANREAMPEDLSPQIPLIHELVQCMDIPVLVQPGFEADDLLATLCRKARERGHNVVVVTGDKDLMQLVGDGVEMFDPMREQRYNAEGVRAKMGVSPERIADLLALAGDSSDNIPGVPKVGPKSAAKLIDRFGGVEDIIAGLTGETKLKAFERAVLEYAADARLSKRLTVLCTEAPVKLDPAALAYEAPKASKMVPFLQSIEAYALMRDLGFESANTTAPAIPTAPAPAPAPAPDVPTAPAPKRDPVDRSTYATIFTETALREELGAADKEKRLCVDLETTSLDPSLAEIVGVALCVPGRAAAYIPLRHRYLGVPKQLDRAKVLEGLRPLLVDPTVTKVGQNLKYDIAVFEQAGFHVTGPLEDSMLAAYLLDPSRPSYSLDNLAREVLAHENIRFNEVAGKGKRQVNFEEVPVERAAEYAAEDADVALRICDALLPRLREASLTQLYSEMEIPLVPVLSAMERCGILVDAKRLTDLSKEFAERLAAIESKAHQLIGEPINLASPKQLSHLFFDKLGYPPGKKTKTGYSTDQEVLETLARDYELPQLVLERRLLAKLKSTYVDALPKMVNPKTGRVHTSYNQTGTATGRLSSSDPNLQNIPIRSEDGRRIRQAFIAPKGSVLISADYSQIELRVMAHLSGDEAFQEAFARGEDIHERTAREILTGGAPADAEMRRRAKAINFGILYGLSAFGLARQLDISRAEAGAYISAYFGRYPRVRAFLDQSIEEGRQRGYVSTLCGRRRWLPDLNSRNNTVRQAAERVAMNTPIQGSAADLIKLAMLRMTSALTERRLEAKLLLQVHDELIVEAPKAEREEVMELVRQEMAGVMKLKVPLEVHVGYGLDWSAAH